MRPAHFSTENPPHPIDCVETKEYINSLRRRIEVQQDSMEHLANQVFALKLEKTNLRIELERLQMDLDMGLGHAP